MLSSLPEVHSHLNYLIWTMQTFQSDSEKKRKKKQAFGLTF